VCAGACKDKHNDCPGWAVTDQCNENPGHTLAHCPNSCGVCKAEVGKACIDVNATACAIWAMDDQCSLNPSHMHRDCAATCGVCSTVCEDKNDSCRYWAKEGECDSNPDVMLTMCPSACGLCSELEVFYRNAMGGPNKDEL